MKKTLKNLLLVGTGLAVTVGAATGIAIAIQSSNKTTTNINQNSIPVVQDSNASTGGVTEGNNSSSNSEVPNIAPEASSPTTNTSKPNVNDQGTNGTIVNKPSANTNTSGTNTNTGNSNVTSKPTTTTPEVSKATLSFKALAKAEVSNDSTEEYKMPNRITKEFKSGNIKEKYLVGRGWGVEVDTVREETRYQSEYYYNQRDFMPILGSMHSQYPNERSQNEVEFDRYNGYDNSEGSIWWAGGVTYRKYVPTSLLLEALGSNEAKANVEDIKLMKVDFSNKYFQTKSEEDKVTLINQYLQEGANKGINFITIENATQSELEKIVIPTTGIKKLTIKDFSGKLTSLRGVQVPNTVKELEFYSTTAKRIDPTILSSETHMIFDHIDGWNAGTGERLTFSPFTVIDLSNRADLTNETLQKALDTVYGKRQYERNFQGDFTNGYIYNLDISGTPIKSLNNVYIPSQSDGRFNIAHVQWSAGVNNHGSVTVQIGGSDNKYPSNDAQVNEWYDSSKWAEQATKLMLNSTGNMKIEDVVTEVKALLKKYPNVNVIDVTDVYLTDNKTQKDLADSLIEMWKSSKETELKVITSDSGIISSIQRN